MITYLTLVLINYIILLILINKEIKINWKIELHKFIIWIMFWFIPVSLLIINLYYLIYSYNLSNKVEDLLNKKIF